MHKPEEITEALKQIMEKGKDAVFERLILNARNVQQLSEAKMPMQRIGNIGIYMAINLDDEDAGRVSARVGQDMLEHFDWNETELWEAAQKNTKAAMPMQLMRLEEYLTKKYGVFIPPVTGNDGIWIALGGDNGGARVIGYQDFFPAAEQAMRGSFIIFPSSIHELLMVKYREGMDLNDLTKMVQEINEKEVEQKDQLDDAAYIYDAETKVVTRWG